MYIYTHTHTYIYNVYIYTHTHKRTHICVLQHMCFKRLSTEPPRSGMNVAPRSERF